MALAILGVAFQNGAAPTLRFEPEGTAMDAEHYRKNVLAHDVLPKIRAAVLGSAHLDTASRGEIPRSAALAILRVALKWPSPY